MSITEIRSSESCDNPVEDIEGVRTIEGVETQHTTTVHDDRYYSNPTLSTADRISYISTRIFDRRYEFLQMFSGSYNEEIYQTFQSKLQEHTQDISEYFDQNKILLPCMSQDKLQNYVEIVDKLLTDLLKLKEGMENKRNFIRSLSDGEARFLRALDKMYNFFQSMSRFFDNSDDPVTSPSAITRLQEEFSYMYDQCLPKLCCYYEIIRVISCKLLSHKEDISPSGESQIPPSRPLSERGATICLPNNLYCFIEMHITLANKYYTQVSEAQSRYSSAKSEALKWMKDMGLLPGDYSC